MKSRVFLLGEDALCRAVLERIMVCLFPGIEIHPLEPAGGKDKIKPAIVPFKSTGKSLIVLADSDATCPIVARRSIEGKSVPNIVLRLAVRSADAWILGDKAIANFLEAPLSKLAARPELLTNPKEELIQFAGYSRNASYRRLMTRQFQHQRQPHGYNALIPRFVNLHWDPNIAAERCPSLKRALSRLLDSTLLQ